MYSLIKSANRNIKQVIILAILICCYKNITAQSERFKTFEVADGLCHPFIYTINQDKKGFMWFGTGEGLCRFDGFNFVSFAGFDSLSNDVVSCSYKDSYGDLWFGFSNGLISSWDGNNFKIYELPGGISSSIASISQNIKGEIFIATQNRGCFFITAAGDINEAHEGFRHKLISTTLFINGYMLLGTFEGLDIIPLQKGTYAIDDAINVSELAYINVQVIKETPWDNKYLVGTEDEGLFILNLNNNKYSLNKIGKESVLAYQNVKDVLFSEYKDLWVCTYYDGLIKLSKLNEEGGFVSVSSYNKETGFLGNHIKTIFNDREKNLWVGTYSEGVAFLAEESFNFKSYETYLFDNNILSVACNENIVWLGGEKGLLQVTFGKKEKYRFISKRNGLPEDKITTLYHSNDITWIGTSKSGIYKLNTKTNHLSLFFKTGNAISNSINHLYSDGDNLYAATKNGIFNFDLTSNTKYHYNTEAGLPHNDIRYILIDGNGRLLFATRSNGLYEINHRGEVEEYFTVGRYDLTFNSIAQDVKGQMWVNTLGQGVFLRLSDTINNFTVENGLKSNYCYSISAADSNYIWIGHRLGISRINIHDYSIKTFDVDIGIEGYCNQNAICDDGKGKLFFGTTDGLIIYDIEKGSRVPIAPKTNIVRLLINDEIRDLKSPIILPYAPYKLRIDYVGLNYNDPEAVKYQYILQGYDMDWSEITDLRYVIYSRIEEGDYAFRLRSFGHDGQYTTESGFTLKIKPPIWKTWWFIILMIITGVSIIVLIIKYREQRQKEIQEYLEKRLDERTREVVEQKEEIEIKNRDITDSINYAQRIQSSILPSIKKLQQSFSGSFVFYQPRDIVSGDFYWFDKVSESRFVIVCADSTGHGVPGAFMSMIGTTLIKDICISQKAESPSEILLSLDEQLTNTLNQNVEEVKSNDGMDIMVCEINTSTSYLRYASAMRPMILYKNGEQMYIKGSRSSIGGQFDNPKDEKEFEDNGMQLNKGDLIYMFSDGYTDQFGGSLGKKFKMVRLKNLLKDIHKKPMEEQYEYVKSTFNLWMEDYEQVDDVLFMGIKL